MRFTFSSAVGEGRGRNQSEITQFIGFVRSLRDDDEFWRLLHALSSIVKPITEAQKESESDRASLFSVVKRWLFLQDQWATLKNSRHSLYDGVDWNKLDNIYADRFEKQCYLAARVAWMLNPESQQYEIPIEWVLDAELFFLQ